MMVNEKIKKRKRRQKKYKREREHKNVCAATSFCNLAIKFRGFYVVFFTFVKVIGKKWNSNINWFHLLPCFEYFHIHIIRFIINFVNCQHSCGYSLSIYGGLFTFKKIETIITKNDKKLVFKYILRKLFIHRVSWRNYHLARNRRRTKLNLFTRI